MTNPELTPAADLRVQIAELIRQILENRRITQAQAAAMAGITRPEISRITRGDLREISLERMMRTARKLGCDVEIRITPPLLIHPEVPEGGVNLVVGSWHRIEGTAQSDGPTDRF